MKTVDRDGVRHMTDVSKIMLAFVFTADQIAVGLLIRLEVAVADDNVSLPGASVIAAKIDDAGGVESGVFNPKRTVADGVGTHVSNSRIENRSVGDTLVSVKAGENTTVIHHVLTEIGAENAPIGAVGDVVGLRTAPEG